MKTPFLYTHSLFTTTFRERLRKKALSRNPCFGPYHGGKGAMCLCVPHSRNRMRLPPQVRARVMGCFAVPRSTRAHASWGASQKERKEMKPPRCGAKTRRGTACQAAAIWSTRSHRYTRCKNHGGLSTGPKTAEGIERIRRAVTKHGRYSKAAGLAGESMTSGPWTWPFGCGITD